MSATGEPNRALVAAWFLAVVPVAGGQTPAPSIRDVPPIDRQADDFYHAISAGGPVKVAWTADPATATLGSDITLTLTVRGAANLRELVRPDLRKRTGFTDHFQITDVPTPPGSQAAEAKFVYRLRPRAVGAVTIPALRYRYYQSRYAEGSRMQTAFTRSVPVTVVPPPAPPASPPVPLDAPEEFFAIAMPSRTGIDSQLLVWLPVVLAPVAAVGWLLVWRTWFPNAARRAAVRRSRAARTALSRLVAARRAADPAAAAAVAVRDYLSARHGLPANADTPSEVAEALAAVGRPGKSAADAEDFFRACDAARFAPDRDTGLSLVARAEQLIAADAGGHA